MGLNLGCPGQRRRDSRLQHLECFGINILFFNLNRSQYPGPRTPAPSPCSLRDLKGCQGEAGGAWPGKGPALGSRRASEHKIGSLGRVGSTEKIRSLPVWGRCWVSASVGTCWASWEWRPTGAGPIGSLGCLWPRPVLGSILAVPAPSWSDWG